MGYKKETRSERKARLTKAGKWEDFKECKEELLQRYLNQGIPNKEARKTADAEADGFFNRFGPREEIAEVKQEKDRRRHSTKQPEAIAKVVQAGIDAQAKSPFSFSPENEIHWVHQNLMVPWDKINLESVPSGGAVALLEEAKGDFRWFYEKFYSKLIVSRTKDEGIDGEEGGTDESEVPGMIEELLTTAQLEAAES